MFLPGAAWRGCFRRPAEAAAWVARSASTRNSLKSCFLGATNPIRAVFRPPRPDEPGGAGKNMRRYPLRTIGTLKSMMIFLFFALDFAPPSL